MGTTVHEQRRRRHSKDMVRTLTATSVSDIERTPFNKLDGWTDGRDHVQHYLVTEPGEEDRRKKALNCFRREQAAKFHEVDCGAMLDSVAAGRSHACHEERTER